CPYHSPYSSSSRTTFRSARYTESSPATRSRMPCVLVRGSYNRPVRSGNPWSSVADGDIALHVLPRKCLATPTLRNQVDSQRAPDMLTAPPPVTRPPIGLASQH